MPVYNAEGSIRAALDSILSQTLGEIELIVSDNASSDSTQQICSEYSAKDARIRYFRRAQNEGASANYRFVLDQATAPFFMWAAADDLHSADFIEENYRFLMTHAAHVASVSPARFVNGTFDPARMGDGPLDDESAEGRVCRFFEGWHANARFYSLFRRDVLVANQSIRHADYFGADWAIILELLALGKFNRLEHGELILGRTGLSNSPNIFRYFRRSAWMWVLPFGKLIAFTARLVRGYRLRTKMAIGSRLLKLNYQASKAQLMIEVRAVIGPRRQRGGSRVPSSGVRGESR